MHSEVTTCHPKPIRVSDSLNTILNSLVDIIVIYDREGDIQWCNSQMANFFRDADGLSKKVTDFFSLDDSILYSSIPKQSSIRVQTSSQAQPRTLDCRVRTVEYNDADCYLLSARDATESHELQARILEQDRLSSIGLLASGLAHEIGSPLMVIRGRAEMMHSRVQGDEQNLETKKGLQIIINQIDRISGLINNLLGLARSDSPKVKDPRLNLKAVTEEVTLFLSHELTKVGSLIEVNVPDDVFIRFPKFSMFQVLMNLIVNSIHAVEEATAANKKPLISVDYKILKNNEIHLSIVDNGPGIERDKIQNLFKPFYTTKEIGKGTGLGLYTSRAIMRSVGGDLVFQPNLLGETGCCFTLIFPVAHT